ncbi:MAG: hypothetical protein JSV56_06680 [Methanomassiliicoccales archaeon]|nr:MAG: hypothetical protein JSV56_06680 [Methanomassiliicoccales archaeon]
MDVKVGQTMSNENWRFYDPPKKLDMKSYKSSIDEFISMASKINNLKAIYRAGSISVPGISDIDLFVVFENNAQKVNTINLKNLSPATQQVVGHDIGYLRKEIFEKFDLFLFVHEPLEFLYGVKIEYQNINKIEDKSLIKSIMIFEWLIHKTLHLQRYQYEKKIPVRILLNKLWSFIYTLRLMEEVTSNKFGEDYIKDISGLRTNWFNLKDSMRNDDLIRLLDSAVDLSYLTVQNLANIINGNPKWLEDHNINGIKSDKFMTNNLRDTIVYRSPSFILIFTDRQWDDKTVYDIYASTYSRFKIPSIVLPRVLFPFLLYLTEVKGFLSNKIKNGLLIPENVESKVIKSEIAYERARLLNRYYSWIKRNRFHWTLLTYGQPPNNLYSVPGNVITRFLTPQILSKISHLSPSASSNDR